MIFIRAKITTFDQHNDNITMTEIIETFIIRINKLASVKNKIIKDRGTIFLPEVI